MDKNAQHLADIAKLRRVITLGDIDRYKSEGRYRHAGALAFILGCDDHYGCHYGMKSTGAFARQEYREGFADAAMDYRYSPR